MPTVQGSLGWSGSGGLYAGCWGSSLSYGDGRGSNGFESDFYAGWAGATGVPAQSRTMPWCRA